MTSSRGRCAGALPDRVGADLRTGHRVDQDQRAVGDPGGLGDFAVEVGVARRVDQVDLVALPLQRRHGQAHRHLALELFRIEVGGRVAVVDRAHSRDGPRAKQQCLAQRRLSRATMREQADITQLRGCVFFHWRWDSCGGLFETQDLLVYGGSSSDDPGQGRPGRAAPQLPVGDARHPAAECASRSCSSSASAARLRSTICSCRLAWCPSSSRAA